MRRAAALLALAVATGVAIRAQDRPAGGAPQDGQPQGDQATFRAGVELLAIDVVVLDGDGRPVGDLSAADFTVKIDGQTRPVMSAELLKVDAQAAEPGRPSTGGATAAPARRVVIAVDHLNIRPGSITPLMNSAAQFVDGLAPRDLVTFFTFPEPGPRVDFTTDKARVRKAMSGLIGNPAETRSDEFDMGISEALIIHEREGSQIPSLGEHDRNPLTLREVMARNCDVPADDLAALDDCRRRIRNFASVLALKARSDARISQRAIQSILQQLGTIDGPKTLVLVSPGLIINDDDEIENVRRLAERSRTWVHVMAIEPERDEVQIRALPNDQRPIAMADRRLRFEGLAAISDPGALYTVVGNGQSLFDRLALELSASYLLAVEARPTDAEARDRQKVSVEVQRRGVRVRSSLAFPRAPVVSRPRSMDDVVREALSSAAVVSDLPLSVATFTQRDVRTGKVRVNVAAHIGQPGASPAEFGVGYMIRDAAGGEVASTANRQRLSPATGTQEPLRYAATVMLDPGTYSFRFGVVDAQGRRSSVVRELKVPGVTDALSTSDLIVGNRPPVGQPMTPAIEPRVSSAELGAYFELYSTNLEDLEWTTVDLEIAATDEGPALVTESADVAIGPQPSWRIVSGAVDLSELSPGRYVARARVLREGETVTLLSRPFVLGERPAAAPAR